MAGLWQLGFCTGVVRRWPSSNLCAFADGHLLDGTFEGIFTKVDHVAVVRRLLC